MFVRLLFLTFALTACSEPAGLRVSAASSLAGVMPTLVERFEAHQQITVDVDLGASSTLARRIESGAPVDVLLSADVAWTQHLQQRGHVSASVVPFASSALVVLVHETAETPENLEALRSLRVAIPADHVPLGRLAHAALTEHSVSLSDLQEATDARAALAWVARGEVDAAMAYASSIGTPGTRLAFRVPGPSARYIAAVTRDSPEALRFLRFLESDEAKLILADNGFAAP